MEYRKEFKSVEELTMFVNFHKQETGLIFEMDLEAKVVWIDVDSETHNQLRQVDIL
jgi:hypothetical protein